MLLQYQYTHTLPAQLDVMQTFLYTGIEVMFFVFFEKKKDNLQVVRVHYNHVQQCWFFLPKLACYLFARQCAFRIARNK